MICFSTIPPLSYLTSFLTQLINEQCLDASSNARVCRSSDDRSGISTPGRDFPASAWPANDQFCSSWDIAGTAPDLQVDPRASKPAGPLDLSLPARVQVLPLGGLGSTPGSSAVCSVFKSDTIEVLKTWWADLRWLISLACVTNLTLHQLHSNLVQPVSLTTTWASVRWLTSGGLDSNSWPPMPHQVCIGLSSWSCRSCWAAFIQLFAPWIKRTTPWLRFCVKRVSMWVLTHQGYYKARLFTRNLIWTFLIVISTIQAVWFCLLIKSFPIWTPASPTIKLRFPIIVN